MTKTATKRRAWTPEHLRTLKTMARQKKASRIAKTLKRSEGATRQKALSMGLSLDSAGLSSHCPPMRLSKRAPPTAGLFLVFRRSRVWRSPLAIRSWVGWHSRSECVSHPFVGIVSTLFLMLNRAYRLFH